MKKVGNFCLNVFGVGISICLFAGSIALVGFVVALCIGGETASLICVFVHKTYFPWVIRLTSVFAFSGLLGMYLNKMSSLTISSPQKEETET